VIILIGATARNKSHNNTSGWVKPGSQAIKTSKTA
jgi:hypothetical protein